MTKDEFKQWLRQLIDSRRLSTDEVAKAASVSPKTIFGWKGPSPAGPLHPDATRLKIERELGLQPAKPRQITTARGAAAPASLVQGDAPELKRAIAELRKLYYLRTEHHREHDWRVLVAVLDLKPNGSGRGVVAGRKGTPP